MVKEKYYRITAFSHLTGVTIRALHYYDQVGLLKPSAKSVSGYRLYSEDDLLRLQQIITLKFLGFPLKRVKTLISKPNFDLKTSLKIQADALKEEAARINKASKLLLYTLDKLEMADEIDWRAIGKITAVLQMSETNKKAWIEKYLSYEEKQAAERLQQKYTPEQWQNYQKQWSILIDDVKNNLHTDPQSKIGQRLVKRWLILVEKIYGDYPELRKKLWEGFKAGAIIHDWLPYNREIITYIEKAATQFKKKK